MSEPKPEVLERMRRVRLIISDVDGVLTDGSMYVDAEGRHFRSFNVRDGLGLALWRGVGGRIALVTGLGSRSVDTIAQQWKCVDCLSHVRDKVGACTQIAERHGVSLDEACFIGDDLIDLKAMRAVGLAAAVADAAPRVLREAHLVTRAAGGQGALRELVERLLEAQGRLDEAVDRYSSPADEGNPAP